MDAPLSNSETDECKRNAVEIVNKKFGNDIKSLSDLKSFYSETKKTTEALESRVSMTSAKHLRAAEFLSVCRYSCVYFAGDMHTPSTYEINI